MLLKFVDNLLFTFATPPCLLISHPQANVVQANMLDSQIKPAMLQLELQLSDDDQHNIASITAHVWRAEMLTGVLEVDRDAIITKAGCCPLHQPGKPLCCWPTRQSLLRFLHQLLLLPHPSIHCAAAPCTSQVSQCV
jgi:hypothetical protein